MTTSMLRRVRALCPAGLLFGLVAGLSGCATENPFQTQPDAPPGPPPKVWGIAPEKFDCESIVATKDISTMAGGEVVFSPGSVTTEGTPPPCTWVLEYKPTEAELKEAEKEQEKLAKKANASGGAGSIEYAVAAWGKSKDKVFGVHLDCRDRAHARTEEWYASLAGNADASEIAGLGKKAVDHKGGQLVFLDGNTPCAVTVNAGDLPTRTALAKLVMAKLTMETAPMRPRLAPKGK